MIDFMLQEAIRSQVDALVKNPSRIHRVHKTRRGLCAGGCGRLVWTAYCRKCRRRMKREAR